MLKTNKSSRFSGQVMIEDQMVVYMTASIDEYQGVATSPSISIQDAELYQKNKNNCRDGIENYLKELWEMEDSE
ncbi:hypothetical protein [Enterococcus sp. N249-2]